MKIASYIIIIYISVFTPLLNRPEAADLSLSSQNLAPLSEKTDLSKLDENRFREYLRKGGTVKRKLQIVVPVSQELYNGNLIRLINSLTRQSVKNRENYELLVVVNNNREISDNPDHPVFIENQLTLQMLEYLVGRTDKTDFFRALPATSQIMFNELAEKSKLNKINIRTLDLSTQGSEEFNIGKIRNRAVQELVREYHQSETDTIIAMIDADATCPEYYAENILVNFITYDIKSLIIALQYEVIEAFNADHFKNLLADRYIMYWMFYTNFMENGSPFVASSQIIASASSFDEVGGVPEIKNGEDVFLATRLQKKGLLYYDFNTMVEVSDRVNKDGFGASKTRYAQMQEKRKPVFHDPLTHFLQRAYSVYAKTSDSDVREIFHQFIGEIDPKYLSEWKEYFDQERLLAENPYNPAVIRNYNDNLYRKDLKKLPTYNYLKTILPELEFAQFEKYINELELKHNKRRKKLTLYAEKIFQRYLHNQPLLSKDDPFELQEFFQNNGWIIDDIYKMMTKFAGEGKANFSYIVKFLETEFPDYFAPYNNSYAKQHANFLFALEKFFLDAEADPEILPKASWIFEVFQLFFDKHILKDGISSFRQSA